jgi:cytochrome c
MKLAACVPSVAVTLTGIALLACTAVAYAAAPDDKASASAGRLAFNNHCRTCHSATEGDNRLGPSLHEIIGAKAGAQQDYPGYSQAMKSSGIVWDEETLERFIADPEDVVRNNNMKPFKGVPDATVRKNIIDFLKSSGDATS